MKRVVIVGGGVVGLWCAVRLRQGGAQVTVLEAEREDLSVFSPTASAAAAGMLAPVEHAVSPHERVALESFDIWRRSQANAEWADGVHFGGAVVISGSGEEAEALCANAQRLGRQARALNIAQLRKLWPFSANVAHATFIADEGIADPLRVLSGLAMQARALGALIEYEADVANVTANAAMTQEGRVYEADQVILAPGAWATEKLMDAAPALRQIRPAKGQLVSVILPGPLGATVRAPGVYAAQRRHDVVLGATLEFDRFDRRPDPAASDALLAKANALFTGEVKPAGQSWAGIRPMSPDGWPAIGRSGDVLVAAGHSRNGWLLAPITAEIISAYVFDASLENGWAALSPERFA
ncbi:MAG: FAD-binding oxidoreductase [Hyphomonadaceae bacterium]|nr:FAD-binding oxidoreductase [Hyphomonadaceae bacterium]